MQKSLEDAEQGLKETEWDKYISETGELLDKMYEDYSETLNDRLDNIDTLMEDMIGWINQKGDLINTTINDVSKQYGYEVSKETQSILSGNGDIVSSFNMDFNNKMAETLDVANKIKDGIYAMAYGKEAKNIVDSEGTGPVTGKRRKDKSGRYWYQYDDGSYAQNKVERIGGKYYHFDEEGYMTKNEYVNGQWYGKNGEHSGTLASWHKDSNGWWYGDTSGWYAKNQTLTIDGQKYTFDENGYLVASLDAIKISQKKLKGYATGSSNIKSSQLAWTQENGSEVIFRKTDGAMLTPLNKGDMVFTSEMSKNLWDLAKNPALVNMGVTVPPSTVGRTINNDNDITIVLPNVQNYDDFKSALTKDPKFVNFVQATTLGQSLGKGKLNRGNY